MSKEPQSGLLVCFEALDRLIAAQPVKSRFVGLSLSKLTASIVSEEAGYDRGYLKRSRAAHLPLLARIDALRMSASKTKTSSSESTLQSLKKKVQNLEQQLIETSYQRDRALAQNLKLWERMRVLEQSKSGRIVALGGPKRGTTNR